MSPPLSSAVAPSLPAAMDDLTGSDKLTLTISTGAFVTALGALWRTVRWTTQREERERALEQRMQRIEDGIDRLVQHLMR